MYKLVLCICARKYWHRQQVLLLWEERMRKKSSKVLQFNLDMMSISFWCKKWVRRNAAGIFYAAAQQYVQKEMAILYAQIMIKMWHQKAETQQCGARSMFAPKLIFIFIAKKLTTKHLPDHHHPTFTKELLFLSQSADPPKRPFACGGLGWVVSTKNAAINTWQVGIMSCNGVMVFFGVDAFIQAFMI